MSEISSFQFAEPLKKIDGNDLNYPLDFGFYDIFMKYALTLQAKFSN